MKLNTVERRRPQRATLDSLRCWGLLPGARHAPLRCSCLPSAAVRMNIIPAKSSGQIWSRRISRSAESFYSAMFGWTFQAIHSGDVDYAVARAPDGDVIAGLLQKALPTDERRQSAWLTFIAVRDVDAAERTALANGAKSVSKPKSYAGRGRQAVLADPDGAVFAILASSTGDPTGFIGAAGRMDLELAVGSGSRPGGHVLSNPVPLRPLRSTARRRRLHTSSYRATSMRGPASIPCPRTGHRRPHWLNFVRVVSADDAAAKAVSLGGKVLVQPYADRHGGKVAVIADPAGAPVGIMEWVASDTKAEPK
jgi:predicted enzyme related to lactoylglutathione lyase